VGSDGTVELTGGKARRSARREGVVGGRTKPETKQQQKEKGIMAESVYKVIEIVGTSTEGWDQAAAAAVRRAGESLRDIRVAEVDLKVDGGTIIYRAKMKVSFKYEE
jgi:flavin-binding protein dodecin